MYSRRKAISEELARDRPALKRLKTLDQEVPGWCIGLIFLVLLLFIVAISVWSGLVMH